MKTKWNDSQSSRKLAHSFLLFLLIVLVYIGGCSFILKSPPYKDPDRVVRILKVTPPSTEEAVSGIEFLEWRNQCKNLGPIAAYVSRGISLNDGTGPERVQSGQVSVDFFPLLGTSPILGRTFIPGDYRLGNYKVAILSYGFWQRRFGADPNVIGRTVKVDKESYTLVGVMPPEFHLPDEYDIWMPLALDDDSLRLKDSSFGLWVMARLKSGITIDQADAEISDIERSFRQKYPETDNGQIVKVTSLEDANRLFQRKAQPKLNFLPQEHTEVEVKIELDIAKPKKP